MAHKWALDGGACASAPMSSEAAAYLALRYATLARDRRGLEQLVSSGWPRVASHAQGWLATYAGVDGPNLARELGTDALSAALAVDALVLEMRTLDGEGASRALGLAREAAGLASRADQPHAQYQAYLALARARRRTGRVPMATRLLGSLARSTPLLYRADLSWEAYLVGIRGEQSGEVLALAEVLESACSGARAPFDRAVAALDAATRADAPRHAEARAIIGALDPAIDPHGLDAATRGFVTASTHSLDGLEGVAMDPSRPDAPIALAIVTPRGLRRVLAPGVALAGPLPRISGSEQGGRTETAIVTLAGASGLDENTFFRLVYGFTFKKALHDGVLRVLLTRIRQVLEPHARLVRNSDRLRVEVDTPFTIIDPRVASRTDNAVLRVIASDRALSAKEIAERTGLPLRTVQAELGRLVEEGVCRREKDGRNTEYLVEDTVVREPSRVVAMRDLESAR